MILVADSGSTKTDWVYFDNENCSEILSTVGFNPLFHNEDYIGNAVTLNKSLVEIKDEITHIYYFGAGCSEKKRNQIVESGLKSVFKNAKIFVEHDLLGAALAACQGKPGIACILGTGSNSCYFDGENIIEKTPSLGYILGDEGSGASMGKSLVSEFLYGKLPIYLDSRFKNELQLTKELILENVYKKPNANSYLASFTKELIDFKNEQWVINFVTKHFESFLKTHVCCFENAPTTNINFVGSIAFYYSDILKICLEKLNLNLGNITEKPIEALKSYYFKQYYLKK